MINIGKDLQAAFDDGYAARDKEIVRCRECEHGRNDGARTAYLHEPLIFCKCEASYKPLNWFCAGGERKDGEHEETV